jgi:flagellar basal-body rod protein FlgF
MNRGIYTGAQGMMTTSQWMDVVSNNLANSGTDGYKADTISFSDELVNGLRSNGGKGSYIGTISHGPQVIANAVDRSVGTIKTTGNPLDVAIKTPQGMFSVLQNGRMSFTRNGSFTVSSDRELVTKQGLPVLDNRGKRISVPGTEMVEIDPDGQVRQGTDVVATLGIYDGAFTKSGNNLWSAPTVKLMPSPDLVTSSIESSNVEAVGAMIDLIKIQRSYEMSQKSIQTQDDMTGKLYELLNRR